MNCGDSELNSIHPSPHVAALMRTTCYDHSHVDLMRRASRRIICQPAAISGEEIAARAGQRNPYAARAPFVTGSLGGSNAPPHPHKTSGRVNEEDEFEDE
jgi:hypothetical protein